MKDTDLSFHYLMDRVKGDFRFKSKEVHTERWQGLNISKRPEMVSYELLNYHIQVPLLGIEALDFYQGEIAPNLPWADNHFEERVCGAPINPGVEWANWPWGDSAKKFIEGGGTYNHNYMERYWPKFAGSPMPTQTAEDFEKLSTTLNMGIRGQYNDLNDLVALLVKEPLTRQAYIPIFFPEDTGIGDGGRKPCTLGYQFILRNNELNVFYPLRSCDFVRHFRDDIYLTVRLLLWVLEQCRDRDPLNWKGVKPGKYNMHITSFHIFKNDWHTLFGESR